MTGWRGRMGQGGDILTKKCLVRGSQRSLERRSSSLPPACNGAEPACPCPQSVESSGGAAQDPGAHGCSADDWQGARGRAGAGGGLPHHRGTQGMALFTWPGRCLPSKTCLLGCQGDFECPPQFDISSVAKVFLLDSAPKTVFSWVIKLLRVGGPVWKGEQEEAKGGGQLCSSLRL